MILQLGLADIWREENPESKRFTWRRSNPLKQARLDFFLLSDYLISYFEDCDILPGYRSDHSIITVTLKFGKEEKHSTFWKFNTSLLKDKQYVDEINSEILRVLKEYSENDFDETKEDISRFDIKLNIPDKLFLDFLLMKIRTKTISYATMKKKKATEKENGLIKEIALIEKQEYKSERHLEELRVKNDELKALRERRMEGVMLRSKAKWIAEGEKITHYFCNLEKRNFISKRMHKLVNREGMDINDPSEIKNEVYRFYKKLYKVRVLENSNIDDLVKKLPKLTPEESESLEGQLTYEEAGIALRGMKHNKSPGTDGFSAEFFKVFWKQLGPFVVRALNDSYADGELSSVQKEGIIICIPKGDKSKEYIKNWRPISLLNVVYKIGTTCIANRLKGVLPKLINEDQTGFVRNRYIGDNIRLIYDLIHYLDTEKLPGLLLCLDFEKAFDSLDWKFMTKALQSYGFGSDMRTWISTFYKNIKSTLIVNGQTTQWLEIERGCRQGDPISPYLFILCVEILSVMIREEKEIKGIHINETEHKIAQFADDAQLINSGDKISFEKSIEIINIFGSNSGLFLNAEKTQAVWLGSSKFSKTIYMPRIKISWNPSKFKILGVWFTLDLKTCIQLNYDEKYREAKQLFQIWSKRLLTPPGRIAVLKSLILSKLIHLWILLPNPPHSFVSNLQKLCFRFVWNNKQDRISRKTVTKTLKNGGLGVPCIRTYMTALKLAWFRKLNKTQHKWKNIALYMYPLLNRIQCYGAAFLRRSSCCNLFWIDAFEAFINFTKNVRPKSSCELLSEPVLYNENIKVGGRMLTHTSWVEKGVYQLTHFLQMDGSFLTLTEFTRKYNINVDFMTFNSCIHSIKKYIKDSKIIVKDNVAFEGTLALKLILSVCKGCRLYYDILIKDNRLPNSCSTWERKLNAQIPWQKVFYKVSKIQEVKLKWFQIRIVHRIIATNVVLKKMKIVENEQCNLCHKERDSIQHIFWHCEHTRRFWTDFEWLLNTCDVAFNVKLSEHLVLFGVRESFTSDTVFDYILLEAKMYIYRSKFQKSVLSISAFQTYIRFKYKIEQFNAKINLQLQEFSKQWLAYKNIVVEDAQP